MTPALFSDIEHEEGCRLRSYRDSVGVLTIGVGHTGPDVTEGLTITDGRATELLHQDVGRVVVQMDERLPWWRKLSDPRQDVLVSMAFQMGVCGLLEFQRVLLAARTGLYDQAAAAMLASKWADQTPARAKRLASQMKTSVRAWAWADPKTPADIGPGALMAAISHPKETI